MKPGRRLRPAPFSVDQRFEPAEGLRSWPPPSLQWVADFSIQPETVTDTFSLPLSALDSRLAIRSSRLEQQSPSSAAFAELKLRTQLTSAITRAMVTQILDEASAIFNLSPGPVLIGPLLHLK